MGNSYAQESSGWRILNILPSSPCVDKGFVIFFDFIIGIDGMRLSDSEEEFHQILLAKKDQYLKLNIFNYKSQQERDIEIMPNDKWGGESLLGLMIRWDCWEGADEQCIRVLEVFSKSPASLAGLLPYDDYILGTPDVPFRGYDELEYILGTKPSPIAFIVYNTRSNNIREVKVTLDNAWEGTGVLGCDLGYGIMHRLPLDPLTSLATVSQSSSLTPNMVSQQTSDEHTTSSLPPNLPSDLSQSQPPLPLYSSVLSTDPKPELTNTVPQVESVNLMNNQQPDSNDQNAHMPIEIS